MKKIMLTAQDLAGCRKTQSGKYSAIDVIRNICGCSKKEAAKKLQRVCDKNDISTDSYQFPGERQRPTPVAETKILSKVCSYLPRNYRLNTEDKNSNKGTLVCQFWETGLSVWGNWFVKLGKLVC